MKNKGYPVYCVCIGISSLSRANKTGIYTTTAPLAIPI